ncbi:hypothetical protein RDI58_009620 [Solanum bulbocastanum]|uniref:Uncharacterized protein n=1 Tax=Solanum bulbocastanum TaxID=147425 RepID=A0AAN8Y0B8_SOLBU
MVFIDRSDRFLVVVGTAPVHFSMQGRPSGRIKVFLLCKAINALFKIFSSRSFILPPQWLSKARHERIKKIGKKSTGIFSYLALEKGDLVRPESGTEIG